MPWQWWAVWAGALLASIGFVAIGIYTARHYLF